MTGNQSHYGSLRMLQSRENSRFSVNGLGLDDSKSSPTATDKLLANTDDDHDTATSSV